MQFIEENCKAELYLIFNFFKLNKTYRYKECHETHYFLLESAVLAEKEVLKFKMPKK